MLIQEQLARDRIHSMLAEAQQRRMSSRLAALRRARRQAQRARARLHRAQRALVNLHASMHTES